MTPSKKNLNAELVAMLEGTLATLEAAHADARAGATHEQAKPENDKDTRALEQSYLARGQAMRIETLKAGLSALRTRAALCAVCVDMSTRDSRMVVSAPSSWPVSPPSLVMDDGDAEQRRSPWAMALL